MFPLTSRNRLNKINAIRCSTLGIGDFSKFSSGISSCSLCTVALLQEICVSHPLPLPHYASAFLDHSVSPLDRTAVEGNTQNPPRILKTLRPHIWTKYKRQKFVQGLIRQQVVLTFFPPLKLPGHNKWKCIFKLK